MMATVENAAPDALYDLSTTDENLSAQELLDDGLKRRAFLGRMACAGLGFAAVGLLNGCGGGSNNGGIGNPTPQPTGTGGNANATPTPTSIDARFPGIVGRNINELVLNLSLSHEFLEVDLYRQALNAASALPNTTPLSNTQNYSLRVPAGALNADSGQAAQDGLQFLRDQAFVEMAHRDFIIATLRSMGAPLQQPHAPGYQFPGGAGSTLGEIIRNIIPVEQNGQRGFLGGAPLLTSLELIQTAATLHSIEARHIAALKHTVGAPPGPERLDGDQLVTPNYPSESAFEYFRSSTTVIAKDKRYYRSA